MDGWLLVVILDFLDWYFRRREHDERNEEDEEEDKDYPVATIISTDKRGVLFQLEFSAESDVRIERVTFRIGDVEEIFTPDTPEHKGWFGEEGREFYFFWDVSGLEPGEYRAELIVLDAEGRVKEDAWWGVKGEDGIWRNVK